MLYNHSDSSDGVQILGKRSNIVKDRPEGPRSLLRRLLSEADQLQLRREHDATHSTPPPSEAKPTTVTAPSDSVPTASPIRPHPPQPPPTPPPVTVRPPAKNPMLSPVPPTLSTPEDRLQAEQALLQLRQKTADVANDFYHGKINRAQFLSLYSHYNEKVIIIERMLARDPNTQAWQPVARPGHTTFLRQHYEARVMAFAVYDQGKFDPITVQGTFPIPTGMVQQILQALYVVQKTRRDLKPVSRKTNNSEWLVVIPGFWTTAIALYSLEPAAYQVKNANNLHQDFERANRQALERGIRGADQLVFPHRALFEQRAEP